MMPTDGRGNAFRAATITYLITIGILLAASFFPEQRLWGLNWYGYFDWPARFLLLLVGVVVPLALARSRWISRIESEKESKGRASFLLVALLVTVVYFLAFYIFRARTHFLGDGYQLLSWLQEGVHHKPWESGTFVLQDWVYHLLGGSGESNALLALQLVSYLSGLLFMAVTSLAAARLYGSNPVRLLYLLGVGTGGYLLLFFGYVESYPLFVLSVGVFSQIGLLAARGKVSRWLILPALALSFAFHVFAVALLPAAVYLLVQRAALGDWIGSLGRPIRLAVAGAMIAAAAVVFAYYYTHSYFFRFTIVPFVADQHTVENYTMFSGKHLLDYFNQLFQLLPALLVWIGLLFFLPLWSMVRQCEYLFLLTLLVPALGLVFIFNPGLGLPRDWDLFSFAGVPLVLLFYYALLDDWSRPAGGRRSALLGIVLGIMLLVPRVATQAVPEKGIALFDNLASLDRVKNSSGRFLLREYLKKHGRAGEAERRRQFDNVLLPEVRWVETAQGLINEGHSESALPLLRRAIRSNPSYHMAWAFLGAIYAMSGQYDSALISLEVASARMPYNAGIYSNLGGVYFAMGKYEQAERVWLAAANLAPDDLVSRRHLLLLYDRQGQAERYRTLLLSMAARKDAPPDVLSQAAELKLRESKPAEACRMLGRALRAGLDSAYVCDLQRRYPELQLLTCENR